MTVLNAHAHTRDPLIAWLEGEAFTVDAPGHELHGRLITVRNESNLAHQNIRKLRLHGENGCVETVTLAGSRLRGFGSRNLKILEA